ncbi:MAG TPA: hypothetical protein VMD74_00365 [Candidatus Methylomirabilis sp.]|nr:hypothetical protein [Candidatus Methylomirabilis sp.]
MSNWEEKIENTLRHAGKKIIPPRELLAKIITVAETEKQSPARIALADGWLLKFFSWRTFALVGAAAVLVVVLIPSRPSIIQSNIPSNSSLAQKSSATVAVTPAVSEENTVINSNSKPLTADDIDAAVVAILADTSEEDSDLPADTVDQSSFADESSAINNFIQTYDENQM